MKKHQQGFSLVEIMIGIVLLGMMSMGMLSLLDSQLKQANYFEFTSKREQIRATLVGQFLSSKDNCRCLFNGAANFPIASIPTLTGYSQPSVIGLYNATPSCSMAFPFINKSGLDNINLHSVSLTNITNISGTYAGDFTVNIENNKKMLGPSILPLKIPVRIHTLPAVNPAQVRFDGCSMKNDSFNLEDLLSTTQLFENSECHWNDSLNIITQDCPADRALIACSGGPGDMDESDEAYWISPDYVNNRCVLTIRKPRCAPSDGVGSPESQRVIASCYLKQ